MSTERPEEFSQSPASRGGQTPNRADNHGSSDDAATPSTTVLVRGETVRDEEPKSASDSPPRDAKPHDSQSKDAKKTSKEVSQANAKLQSRLPALDDDADIGVQKAHVVTRDGKADLSFTGALLASAAPPAPREDWQEYRIYETNGGKYVFSKVTRSVFVERADTHEAEVYDPAPSSVPSKLLKSARDLTHSRQLTWRDAAAEFFGYDPLAKALYRKLSGQFEEHIS